MIVATNPPATKVVDEALRLVCHVVLEHARMEQENAQRRGTPYITLGELLGVRSHAYNPARVDELLVQHVRPILAEPLQADDDPRYSYTAATKVDRVLVLLGTLCVALSLSPISHSGALNNLRERLNQLLGV
jgi:hypothetical protein